MYSIYRKKWRYLFLQWVNCIEREVPTNVVYSLKLFYLLPWKSGRTCMSSVRADTNRTFLSCIMDSKILFNNSYMEIPSQFAWTSVNLNLLKVPHMLTTTITVSMNFSVYSHNSGLSDIIMKQLLRCQIYNLLWEAARLARRGAATWFSIMWSRRAPVALWPPSVSQYSGTIAEKWKQNQQDQY